MPLRIFFFVKKRKIHGTVYTSEPHAIDFRNGISLEIAQEFIRKKYGEPQINPEKKNHHQYCEITGSQRVNVSSDCITPEDIYKVLVNDTAPASN